ncbi:MAG: hypothetical protein E7200_07395 [Selenomonas ruminantium]|nr:hypothetical protein [Selenomonas ruminantium]
MSCSICGEDGHNARTCSYKDKGVQRNRSLWVKFDNLTEREESDLLVQIIKDKRRIAPKGRATSANGDVRELPNRIREALKLPGYIGENDEKKKK